MNQWWWGEQSEKMPVFWSPAAADWQGENAEVWNKSTAVSGTSSPHGLPGHSPLVLGNVWPLTVLVTSLQSETQRSSSHIARRLSPFGLATRPQNTYSQQLMLLGQWYRCELLAENRDQTGPISYWTIQQIVTIVSEQDLVRQDYTQHVMLNDCVSTRCSPRSQYPALTLLVDRDPLAARQCHESVRH